MGKNKKEAKKKSDNDPEALKALGNKAFVASNFNEAIELYS